VTLQQQIRANRLRTGVVLALFALLMVVIALIVGFAYQPSAVAVVGVIAIGYGVVSWFASGSMIAAVSGAHQASREGYPEAYRTLETVAIAAGLARTPPLYVVDDPSPNAFAAGRGPDHAYVAVTTGLLETMPHRELEGVLAHEVSHIRNRDVRLMSLAAVLVGIVALVADMIMRMALFGGMRSNRRSDTNAVTVVLALFAAVLAPLAAVLLQMSLSRNREYQADASAAEITGDGEGMALALKRLQADPRETRHVTTATAHLWIESPIHRVSRRHLSGLFDTHPPLDQRIARLEAAGGFVTPELSTTRPVVGADPGRLPHTPG
jgi:heat shock protein HtpX